MAASLLNSHFEKIYHDSGVVMEATLILVQEFDDSEFAEAQCLFYSNDAPAFSDEVKSNYRALYECTEQVIPPEIYERFGDRYVVSSWTCSPDQAEDICDSFVRMSECKVAAYLWCDEYEEYFIEMNETLTKVSQSSLPERVDLPELSDEWGEEDLEMIAIMQYLLKARD